jgi:hypothetical protein
LVAAGHVTIISTAELSRKHFDDPPISVGTAPFPGKPAWEARWPHER